MSDPKNVQFSLKVLINKQKTKVLYAEVDSQLADVLLSFLTLPLGTIVRVLKRHNPALALGSLTTLYNGLANLDSVHFQIEGCRQMLLNPRTSSEAARHRLKLNVDDTDRPRRYTKCGHWECNFSSFPYIMIDYGVPVQCGCGKSSLSKEIRVKDSTAQGANDGLDGVFTLRTAHFIISDDLQLLPSVTGDAIRFLRNLGITDTDGTELMDVTFGFKEIMDLLKGSFLSQTPLTDIVLNKRQTDSVTVNYDAGALVPLVPKEATSNVKKMIVKAIIQESTKKLLFVEAEDNFVNFLFSLLTIPLGRIENLLGGNSNLKNIDNLYRSLGNINGDKYLKNNGIKTMLLNPKLHHGFTFQNQFLPLIEETHPSLYYYKGTPSETEFLSFGSYLTSCYGSTAFLRSQKGQENYVKGPTMYMVTDDLTVTPLCTTSSLTILNRLKVPLSDVEELELDIGMEEALSILRASLSSPRALTDGLINPMLKKQPKQEH